MFDDPEEKYYKKMEDLREKLEANSHLTDHTKAMFNDMLWEVYDETSTGESPCELGCPRNIPEDPNSEDDEGCELACYQEFLALLREMIEIELKEDIAELKKANKALEDENKKLILALQDSEARAANAKLLEDCVKESINPDVRG